MGIRRLIGKQLRTLSARMLPLIAYFSLIFGRRVRGDGSSVQILEVRDRKSDLTVVSFAGIAALHGGMVNFEFTELLRKFAFEPNVVFVRDPLCSCYHLRPDGSPGGLDYYAAEIDAAVRKLGARHVVTIGTSIGGMAAVAIGHRLGYDQVIAFSPTWPPERYFLERGPKAWLERLRLAVRKPAVLMERLLLAQMARVSAARLHATVGAEGILDLEGELARAGRTPRISVFYGEGCAPDVHTAKALAVVSDAEIVPLTTSMHNSTAYLKRNGRLIPEIVTRVDRRMKERGIVPRVTLPPPAEPAPERAAPQQVAS